VWATSGSGLSTHGRGREDGAGDGAREVEVVDEVLPRCGEECVDVGVLGLDGGRC
jgi:hypothetical protein